MHTEDGTEHLLRGRDRAISGAQYWYYDMRTTRPEGTIEPEADNCEQMHDFIQARLSAVSGTSKLHKGCSRLFKAP